MSWRRIRGPDMIPASPAPSPATAIARTRGGQVAAQRLEDMRDAVGAASDCGMRFHQAWYGTPSWDES
ncbi:hypothetical protein B4N89_46495 [Embleya scabrispora]|uniref:Uncharacterized protein n=1 Tax=Embleya scabrispora TaxID=159449 RepID=A0A1T3NI23_9ACTN|nr:hypothetical protein B4N89_46495 [Embleya scabrispora]